MGERMGLTHEEWALIGPLLPLSCRPPQDNRRYFEGVMWMARTIRNGGICLNEYRQMEQHLRIFRRYRR